MLDSKQLADRLLGVGGSDAPCLVGCDPYRQPLDLYLEKTGEIAPVDDLEEHSEPVRWGNLLEDVVASEWARRHSHVILPRREPFVHPDYPFMRGNVDRLLSGKEEGLEVKTRGTFNAEDYGPDGTDQVKESDIIQCQHYMACSGYKLWHMAVLIGGQDLRSYTIPRDEGLVSSLAQLEGEFWASVERREPPDFDFAHRSCPGLIKHFFPGTNGKSVLLPARAVDVAREMEELSLARRTAEKAYETLKSERDVLLGKCAIGVLPDGSGGWMRKEINVKERISDGYSFMGIYYSKRHKSAD